MNIGIILAIAVLGIWALSVFLGVIGGVSKMFKPSSPVVDSSEIKSQEEKTSEDASQKQQQFFEDVQQKMQDEQQKYQP